MPGTNQRCREWCWTLNNYAIGDGALILAAAPACCTYLVYQHERGESGTPHLQGYVCLLTVRTMLGCKRAIFSGSATLQRVHLEACRGTSDQAIAYCIDPLKRDSVFEPDYSEFGNRADVPKERGQGARNDIAFFGSGILQGTGMRELAFIDPSAYVKYFRGFEALQRLAHAGPRVAGADGYTPLTVYWFYGLTGTGKSLHVHRTVSADELYLKPSGNEWWDGYTGQSTILLDDYRASWFRFGYLLQLLDRYPFPIAIKGSYTNACWHTVFITAPVRPEVMYASEDPKNEGRIDQLLRRITEVRQFGEDPPDPAPLAPLFTPLATPVYPAWDGHVFPP